jgi:hypothetical protein
VKTAAVAAAAALAALGALLLAHWSSTPAAAPTTALAVRASFDRTIAGFGDPVTARVDVVLDRSAVKVETLHTAIDLAPLTLLSPARTTRTVSGRLETISIVRRAACLTAPCLASTLTLHPVRVTVTNRGGGVSGASASWQLQLRSRVTAKDLAAATPHFAADVAPPAPSYRIAPSTAAAFLDVIAAIAAAGAAALLALQLLAVRRGRRRAETGDELARALRLVREAEGRPVPDRRRALALLARLLRNRDETLRDEASRLAWSAPAPEAPAIDALVTDVESGRAG